MFRPAETRRSVRYAIPPLWRPGVRALPDRQVHVVYRLLVEVPLVVSFPSVIYVIEWSDDRIYHHLMLREHGGGSGGREILSYQDDPAMPGADNTGRNNYDPRVIFTTGVDLVRPSVLDTVFARLARENRAEILLGPHCRVTYRGPLGQVLRTPKCGWA